MPLSLIAAMGGNASGAIADQGNRSIQQLSDGSWIAVEKLISSTTWNIYRSTNRTSWSLLSSHNLYGSTLDNLAGQGGTWGMHVDASDNIHIVFATSARTVLYRRLDWSAGPVFTDSGISETAIAAPTSTSESVHLPAVEVLDSGVVVVACVSVFSPTSTGNTSSFRVRVRHTGGTWGTLSQIASGASTTDAAAVQCGLARDLAAASGGTQKVVLNACGGLNTEHQIRVLTITQATGAIALTAQVTNSNLSRAPYGNKTYLKVFPHSAGRWRIGMYYSSTQGSNNGSFTAAEISATASVVATSLEGVWGAPAATTFLAGRAAMAWLPDRLVMAVLDQANNTIIFVGAVFSGTTITFAESSTVSLNALGSNLFAYLVGGDAHRNINSTEHLFGYIDWLTDNFTAFHFPTPTYAPTNVKPANLTTAITDIPVLSAIAAPAIIEGSTYNHLVEWNLAQNAGFTTALRSQVSGAYINSGVIETVLATASQLSQTTWYLRARVIDITGQPGPWSATTSFTVTHPPAATPNTPSGGVTRAYGAGTLSFEWAYSDTSPVDPQSAYQVQVEDNSSGSVVADSGKVTAAGVAPLNSYGVPTLGRADLAIGAPYKDIMLRWRVRVWDSDDIPGSYSGYALFMTADPPSVAIVTPANTSTVDNPQPLISWTFTVGGTRYQSQYRVLIVDTDSLATVHDSGWRSGPETSYMMPQAYLVNNGNYEVQVEAQDNIGLTASDLHTFDAVWTPPAVPSGVAISATYFDSLGYITVGWNPAVIDADFHAWRIYRRVTGTTDAELVYETTNPDIGTFNDWYALSGVSYDYNVVQVANRFGSLIESNASWAGPTVGSSSHYWLIHPDDNAKNIRLFHVISDEFSEEYESETTLLIGRGRKTDYGSRWGFTGTMVCEVRAYGGLTARQIKQQLEAIKAEKRELFLKNPFGDLWQISVGDLQTSRLAGVGTQEYCNVTVPYQEVS